MVQTWRGNGGNNYKQAHKTGGFLGFFQEWESWKMYGDLGNDTLIGSPKNDTIEGNGGDLDTIVHHSSCSGEGDDKLYGKAGNDSINGGSGSDSLYGEADRDTLFGENGCDYLNGGSDNDSLYGGSGTDSLYGSFGNDRLYGEYGNDLLYGESGDDILIGGSGIDSLFGNSGNDRLYGNSENDYLNGGENNDTLVGVDSLNHENEYDTLTGGANADKFVLGDASYIRDYGEIVFYKGAGYARITDFDWQQGDKIQVVGNVNDYSLTEVNWFGSSEKDTLLQHNGDTIAVLEDINGSDILINSDLEFI